MKKILMPYDDSESSRRALAYALNPDEVTSRASIHLINVQPWPPVYSEYMPPLYITDVHESLTRCGEQVLAPAVEKLKAAGREHSAEVHLGDVPQMIIDRAKALGCDHIIMGSRGLSMIKGLLLGSVANRVLQFAEVPVTLLH